MPAGLRPPLPVSREREAVCLVPDLLDQQQRRRVRRQLQRLVIAGPKRLYGEQAAIQLAPLWGDLDGFLARVHELLAAREPVVGDPCDPDPCTTVAHKTRCQVADGDAVCSCEDGWHDDGAGGCSDDPCVPNPCDAAGQTPEVYFGARASTAPRPRAIPGRRIPLPHLELYSILVVEP